MKRLTYDDLADLYDEAHPGGRPARTHSMGSIVRWAEKQDGFAYDGEGYLCLKEHAGESS